MTEFFTIKIPVSWIGGEVTIDDSPIRASGEVTVTIDNHEAQSLIDELTAILKTRTKEPRKPKHDSIDIKEFIL